MLKQIKGRVLINRVQKCFAHAPLDRRRKSNICDISCKTHIVLMLRKNEQGRTGRGRGSWVPVPMHFFTLRLLSALHSPKLTVGPPGIRFLIICVTEIEFLFWISVGELTLNTFSSVKPTISGYGHAFCLLETARWNLKKNKERRFFY